MIVTATSKKSAMEKAILRYQERYKERSEDYRIAKVERQGIGTYEVTIRRR